MVYYKSCRYIDGKVRWVVTDEDGNINSSPTREQLKMAILDDNGYIKNRKCCICERRKTYIDNSRRQVWIRYRGKNNEEKWDGKSWLCSNCYHKILNDLPDSHKNIIKSMVKSRNKSLEIDVETGKGIIGECTVAKVLGIRDCHNCDIIKDYNFHNPYDLEHIHLLKHINYGKIDVKAAKLIENPPGHYKWTFHTRGKIDCDYYFCIGFDREWNIVEVLYIIPNDRSLIKSDDIGIYKYVDPSRGSKWEEFKVEDIDVVTYNDAYQALDIENCPIFKNSKYNKGE